MSPLWRGPAPAVEPRGAAASAATAITSRSAVFFMSSFRSECASARRGRRGRSRACLTAAGGEPAEAVHGREPDEAVDDPAGGVRLAEVEADHPRNQVELRDRDEAPVEAADEHECKWEQIALPEHLSTSCREVVKHEFGTLLPCWRLVKLVSIVCIVDL